jgi:hypothetical protein
VRRADRRVRRLVARYAGCLSGLPARQRRVLRLRAGIGPREPATRAAVARRLDLPVARVRVAERRGLRALRRSGRDGCAAAVDGAGADPGLATGPAGDGPAAASAVLASGTGGGEEGNGAGAGGGERDASGGSADGAGGGTDEGDGAAGDVRGVTATSPPVSSPGTDVTLVLLALVMAGLLVGAARIIRRERAS